MERETSTSRLRQPSHFGKLAFAACGDVFYPRRRIPPRNGTEGLVNRFYGLRRWVLLAASWGALALLAIARSTQNSSTHAEPRDDDATIIMRVLDELLHARDQVGLERLTRACE